MCNKDDNMHKVSSFLSKIKKKSVRIGRISSNFHKKSEAPVKGKKKKKKYGMDLTPPYISV